MSYSTRKYSQGKNGQAIIFIMMAMLILVFAFLWNVDLHRIIAGKDTAQNAGDSAALAAAKWQGASINLIGELNIMHALAMSMGDDACVDAATNSQARICFTGPVAALVMAQVAAKNNKIYNNDDFTKLLQEHANDVLDYGSTVGGAQALPEPYPGAWTEYAQMLDSVAADGIAAAPDNTRFYGDSTSGHILLDREFYQAVAGRSWCWFFLNCGTSNGRTILDDFTDYSYFGPVPGPQPPNYENSEIFSIGAVSRDVALERYPLVPDAMSAASETEGIDFSGFVYTNVMPVVSTWYFFSRDIWNAGWPGMDPDGPDPLPLTGPVKPEYDYTGADSVIRLSATTYRLSDPDNTDGDEVVWTAAAKPFGFLRNGDTEHKISPITYSIILPAFHDVRLIPLDAATSGGDGSFDIAWRHHTDEHLPLYTATGIKNDGCKYCRLLKTFEDPVFRDTGVLWLAEYSHTCKPKPSRGGIRGGGTRRGH